MLRSICQGTVECCEWSSVDERLQKHLSVSQSCWKMLFWCQSPSHQALTNTTSQLIYQEASKWWNTFVNREKLTQSLSQKNFLCYRHTIQYRGEQRRGLNASLKKNDVLKTRRDVSCQSRLFRKACRTSSEKFKKQHIKIKWLYNCNIVEWR